MRVFVTGASGFIGSAVVPELVSAGHDVVGLARSDRSAAAVERLGATARRGDLDDLRGLREAADAADGVVHLANKHDWGNLRAMAQAERDAVQAFSEVLSGSDRPFVLASGVAGLARDRPSTERDPSPDTGLDSPRGGAENLALGYAERGVRVVSARFAPSVHAAGDHGFVAIIAAAYQRRGTAAYPGDGRNRWPAVHRSDAARLVRLGLESAPAGSVLHAVDEEGVLVRDIAEALASRLGLPTESVTAERLAEEIPFVGGFLGADIPAANELTRELLGWKPEGPTLLDDIVAGHYDPK
ncbi:SDR family oxidoreductase [Myceligenerans cantabricum]